MRKSLEYSKHDDSLFWGRCGVCGDNLKHPPVKMPSEVEKSVNMPGHYDITYNKVCSACTISLLSRRLLGIRAPKIILENLNPTDTNRWTSKDVRKAQKEE